MDSDKDGVLDRSDACPTKKARFDYNKNGCTGPFAKINPRFRYGRLTTSRGIVFIEQMTILGLPRGAVVTMTGELRGRATAGSSGGVRVGGAEEQLELEGGATVGVRIVKSGFIGYDAVLMVTTTRGPVATKVRCIPAVGPQTPAPCNRVDRGK